MNQPTRGFWAAALAAILLVACGGDDAPLPTIGPAGGTVTGANGATIVVPPGALAQEVALQITEINAASASLPAGVERVSAVYALTPHGTAFAVPVTVTIPFDPTLVPAGRSVQFLKTSDAALAVWGPVAGAAVSGNTISATVSSLSNAMATLEPATTPTPPPPSVGTAWESVGGPIVAGQAVRLGGLATYAGRVAVAYVVGRSGTAGLVGELRVSVWNGETNGWTGSALSPTGAAPSLGSRSIAFDAEGRMVVAWLDRLSGELVVQRTGPGGWQKLGNPQYRAGATTGDPQIAIDQTNDRPIVSITSGPNITVREWAGGEDWLPATTGPMATGPAGGVLTATLGGQRFMAIPYGTDAGATQLLARLYTPDSLGRYLTEFGPPIVTTPIDASRVHFDLDNNGNNLYALIGERSGGPLVVRHWSNVGEWGSVGADLNGLANFSSGAIQFRVLQFPKLPVLAYMEQFVNPVVSRRIGGLWWTGTAWQPVPSANNWLTESAEGFAFDLDKSASTPYVALALRESLTNPLAPAYAQKLVVRRFAPATLSLSVDGPILSGYVTGFGVDERAHVGTQRQVPVPPGAVVTLVAVPNNAGVGLQSWQGCDSVEALQCTVTVDQSKAVTATFQFQ